MVVCPCRQEKIVILEVQIIRKSRGAHFCQQVPGLYAWLKFGGLKCLLLMLLTKMTDVEITTPLCEPQMTESYFPGKTMQQSLNNYMYIYNFR